MAVLDSGIDTTLADLKTPATGASRVVYSESFVGGTAADAYGHGTHVAGIVGGNGAASAGIGFTRTFQGIAPQVNLINLRVLDANGVGTDSAVIAAIERAIELKSAYNIRVMNLSLGRPVFESFASDPLCIAVEAAWKAGIVVVVSAGNNGRDNSRGNQGYGTITSPGNDPYVITVGAMKAEGTPQRADDQIAQLQLEGPVGGGPRGEAGPAGAGQPGGVAAGPREHARCELRGEPAGPLDLRRADGRRAGLSEHRRPGGQSRARSLLAAIGSRPQVRERDEPHRWLRLRAQCHRPQEYDCGSHGHLTSGIQTVIYGIPRLPQA